MLKSFLFAGLAVSLSSTQALALSCLRPSVADSYRIAEESAEAYYIALGRLERAGPNEMTGPAPGSDVARQSYRFAASFEGDFLTRDGFASPRSVPVTVEVGCIEIWCGNESLSPRGLYFLRADGGTLVLDAGPCGGMYFDDPDAAQLREVTDRF